MSELGAAPTSELSEFRAHARRSGAGRRIKSVDGPRRRLLAPQGLPMARKRGGGRNRFSKYIRGVVDHKLDIGSIGAQSLLSSNLAGSVIDSTRVSSVDATWSLDQLTPGADDGPILVGVAHSNYTSTEIEEWVENTTGSWDPGDLTAQEIGRRMIRQVGVFRIRTSGGTAGLNAYVLNDGTPIKTKLNWALNEGDTLKVWAYNTGSSTVGTTDPQVRVEGHCNLWQKN